jgi:hypothetical protein
MLGTGCSGKERKRIRVWNLEFYMLTFRRRQQYTMKYQYRLPIFLHLKVPGS